MMELSKSTYYYEIGKPDKIQERDADISEGAGQTVGSHNQCEMETNMGIKKLFEKISGGNQLSQKMNAPVLGEKTVQADLPKLCRKAGSEGIVFLKNDGILPIRSKTPVSILGRVQIDYFYVGYGSGGDVNPPYTISLPQGLREDAAIMINENLACAYENWCVLHPVPKGTWGHWPRHYEEMPVDISLIQRTKGDSEIAIVVLGRAAGEDRENLLKKGSYYLTDAERTC